MDHSIQVVISLLVNYWQGLGALDLQTKNYCRRLTETIRKVLPATKATLIIQDPDKNGEELFQIMDQLFRTDPNSRQLINILAEMADPNSPKAQSVKVSGDNNKVITVGRDMVGEPTVQNSLDMFSKNNINQEQKFNSTPNPPSLAKDGYENKIFVSYAWGGDSERVVEALQQALSDHGIEMIRDKQHLAYKGSIEEFEHRIGKGKCVVLVISDKYLRSKHCMDEFVKIWENHNLRDRIFPIVLPDALIFDANKRLEYINYWDEQIEQLNTSIKNVKVVANLTETADLDKLVRIRQIFSHLVNLVSDMNVLTSETHATHDFATLIHEIERSMGI